MRLFRLKAEATSRPESSLMEAAQLGLSGSFRLQAEVQVLQQ